MQIRFRFPLRHPYFPDWAATPTRIAQGACVALSGNFPDLVRAAGAGVRPSRAVFVMHNPGSVFLTDRERDVLWELFQVPAFALMLDGEGRLVGWECEAHDGMHIGMSCPESVDRQEILSDDSVLGYRIPWDRFTIESSPCECGRPGQRLKHAPKVVAKPVQSSASPGPEREVLVG